MVKKVVAVVGTTEIAKIAEVVNPPVAQQTIVVSVGKIPGEINDLPISGTNITAKDVLKKADIKVYSEDDVQVNGVQSNLSSPVENGDTVLVISNIRGN